MFFWAIFCCLPQGIQLVAPNGLTGNSYGTATLLHLGFICFCCLNSYDSYGLNISSLSAQISVIVDTLLEYVWIHVTFIISTHFPIFSACFRVAFRRRRSHLQAPHGQGATGAACLTNGLYMGFFLTKKHHWAPGHHPVNHHFLPVYTGFIHVYTGPTLVR